MSGKTISKILFIFLCLGLISGIVFYWQENKIMAAQVNTSVTITVCGNGIIESGEQCDDSNTVSGDGCSSTCQIEGGPAPPQEEPGRTISPSPEQVIYATRVILEGGAYPNALVNILKDGQFLTTTQADSQASFRLEIKDLTPGTYTFGLWAEDKNGLKSNTFTITFYVAPSVTTTVSGILLPPTINLSKEIIVKGEGLGVSGQSVPGAMITIFIYQSNFLKENFQTRVTVNSQGDWYYLFDTKDLNEEIYSVKVKSDSREGLLSIFSKILTFEIKSILPPQPPIPPVPSTPSIRLKGDLNQDSKVNLIDFSILLYWWGKSNKYVDQNGDGVVDLIDFSIMLYYWTG